MDKKQLHLFSKPSGRTAILTASGFILDLVDPDATGLPVTDVARGLAYEPRWRGATKTFYSVAEHSVMVSRLVPKHLAYDALWHDSLEFITGDWPSPLKIFLGREEINRRLAPIERAFEREFRFTSHNPEIKVADNIAMATELRDLLPPAWMDWGHLPPPAGEIIQPIGPEKAYELFLERYEEVRYLARPQPAELATKKKTAGMGM